MRWWTLGLVIGTVLAASFGATQPVVAKWPPFTVTVAASPTAYSGACPTSIKYTAAISGDKGSKLQYQFARVVGGVPTLSPWTNAAIPAGGTLLAYDVVPVGVAQAGLESETVRVLPGPVEATVKVLVKCTPPTPVTPAPTITKAPSFSVANPGVSRAIVPLTSPSPKTNTASASIALRPVLQKLQAPINLTSRNSRDACAAHGGSAESFACYIALPAGKLVLDWDYPYNGPIDGFNIYRADTPSSSGPTTIHMLATVKPVMTQGDPTLHFEVLDQQQNGSCFAVTAFHGSDESDRSIRFCLGSAGVAKFISLNPDRAGAMVADFYIYTDKSVQDNMYANYHPFIRDLLSLAVGYTHVADLFRDQAHTQVSGYTNSLFRGYLHFSTFALNGHVIAQAKLNLLGGSGPNGQICLAHFGPADHLWNPGDNLGAGYGYGNGPYQGPDLHLDVTPLVQGWANSPGTNLGISLDGEQHLVIYDMVILSSECLSNIQTETLDVTYY